MSRRWRCTALVLGLLAHGALAVAQTTEAPSGVTFLSGSAFHMTAAHLSSDDERFVWDTNFGGNLDLVDYGVGRLNFEANYQAILGDELRAFDPNQGNYILAGALSARARRIEVSGVFYHQSRHLSDRAKQQPVDWNMVGVRIATVGEAGRLRLTAQGDVRTVVQKSFVDYEWEIDVASRLEYAVSTPASVIASGGIRWLGTDGRASRGTQAGARGEGGVRLAGKGAAVELFVAVERRIDPSPLEFSTATWAMAGFRLLSR